MGEFRFECVFELARRRLSRRAAVKLRAVIAADCQLDTLAKPLRGS